MKISNGITLVCLVCLIVASFGIPVLPITSTSTAAQPLAAAAPALAPRVVRVAVYDEPNTTLPAYASTGMLGGNVTAVVNVLVAAGCQVTRLTVTDILNHQLLTARFDVLVLVDNLPREVIVNAVKEFWLGGGGVLSLDSAILFLCYAGMLPPESEGSSGFGVYWNWAPSVDQHNVTVRHPVTKAFHQYELVDSESMDFGDFDWTALMGTSIAGDLVKLGTKPGLPNDVSMIALDPTIKGGRVVQLPCLGITITSDLQHLLADAVNWLCPRPKARLVFDLSHQPWYGVDAWDQLALFTPRYSDWRDDLVSRTYTFDKLYPAATGNLTATRLAPYDLLVIVAPRTNFTAAEVSVVRSWIAGGGSLLILGDNDALSTTNKYINYLLASLALRLENVNSGLTGTYTYHVEHPTTEACTGLRVVIPGYVNYSAPAYPIWGTDAANILVAAQTYGAGRVLLGADINWLDDADLAIANNRQYAINVVNWLTAATATVLLYTDEPSSANYYRTPVCQALNDLSVSYALTFSGNYFNLSLNLYAWALVIVDNPWSSITSYYGEIGQYVDAGGRLFFSGYQVDNVPSSPLWPKLGFAFAADMPNQVPVHIWSASHDIFTTPNTYGAGNFTPTTDYGDEGDLLTVHANATALAGNTTTSTAGRAIIVLRNDKHTLYNAYLIDQFAGDLDDSTYEDRFELWENEIAFMLAALVTVPTLPPWLLPLVVIIIVLVIVIVVVVVLLRRRKASAK